MWAGPGLSTPRFRLGVAHLALPNREPPSCSFLPFSSRRRRRSLWRPDFPLSSSGSCQCPRGEWAVHVGERPWNTMFLPSWGGQGDSGEEEMGEDRGFTDFCFREEFSHRGPDRCPVERSRLSFSLLRGTWTRVPERLAGRLYLSHNNASNTWRCYSISLLIRKSI